MTNKNYMTVCYPKYNICAICGAKGYTELHHILGRKHKSKNIVDDKNNLIELCILCHHYHTDPTIMRRIAKVKINENPDWLQWCLQTAQEIGTKPNWVKLCYEMEEIR
jgi:hypothetical protein